MGSSVTAEILTWHAMTDAEISHALSQVAESLKVYPVERKLAEMNRDMEAQTRLAKAHSAHRVIKEIARQLTERTPNG